jgi:hypothetical protein
MGSSILMGGGSFDFNDGGFLKGEGFGVVGIGYC